MFDLSYSVLLGRKETAKVKLSLPTVARKIIIWKFWLKKKLGVLDVPCYITAAFLRKIKVILEKLLA